MLPSLVVTAARRFRSADLGRAGRGARSGCWRARRERGAVLVHAAVAMTGLLAFSALTIDLGTVWVARAQAQNAVDAAALAGGISFSYVEPCNTDAAAAAARTIAQTHTIWGDAVTPSLLTVTAGSCPSGSPAIPGDCLNVAVERGGAAGAPLPVFFSRLFGSAPTRVRASASAKAMLANVAPCVRPIGMPDRWIDTYDETPPRDTVWRDDDLYARYDIRGVPNIPPGSADSYDPPSAGSPGSGLTVADFTGVRVTRRVVDPTAGPLGADNLIAIDLPRPDGHPEAEVRYWQNLGSCSGIPLSIGATAPAVPAVPSSYTEVPLQSVIDSDSEAYWDDATNTIRGSRFAVSPRLITLPLIDPEAFSHQNRSGGRLPDVVVRNLVGFFLEDVSSRSGVASIRGVITPMAGSYDPRALMLDQEAAFLRSVALVR